MNIEPFFLSAQRLFNKDESAARISDFNVNDNEKTVVLKESDQELSPPEKLPEEVARRYSIRRALGKGSFGIVYLAEDRKIGRLVAIKQLLKPFEKDPEIYERFTQEARIGAQLDHPNIVNVFSLEEDKDSACIIMEYLGGGSLASYIQKEKKIDVQTSARIIIGVLTGLDAAHHVMVIHRDIKPQNILFGALGEPKISDFGVAHLPENAGGGHTISRDMARRIVGTPLYMPPEQIMKKQIDCRADLYSAGAVLYEMLTGRKIFNIDVSNKQMTVQTITTRPPDPIEAELNIPEKLQTLVMRFLSKNPEERPPDAKTAIRDIHEAIGHGTGYGTGLSGEATVGTVGPMLSSPAAMLEDVIRLFLIDGSLSVAERKELNRRAERLGVSKVQAEALEEKVREELGIPSLRSIWDFRQLVEAFIASSKEHTLTEEQMEFLQKRGCDGKITKKEMLSIIQECRDRAFYLKFKNNGSGK